MIRGDHLTAFRQSQKHQSKLFPVVICFSFSSSGVLFASLITAAVCGGRADKEELL